MNPSLSTLSLAQLMDLAFCRAERVTFRWPSSPTMYSLRWRLLISRYFATPFISLISLMMAIPIQLPDFALGIP